MEHPNLNRIAVIASRDFEDYARLVSVVDPHLPAGLVSGVVQGADVLAERLARERGLTIDVTPTDWQRYGRGAGPIRNKQTSNRSIESLPSGMASLVVRAQRSRMRRKWVFQSRFITLTAR